MRIGLHHLLLLVAWLATNACHASPMSREEFLEAVKDSFVTEMGSVGTTTGDEKSFGEYICKNWPNIYDEYDSLAALKTDQMHGLRYSTISLACEELSPFEYLDFLDKVLDVLEQRRVQNDLSENSSLLLCGRNRKDSFLAVNWEHPRVQAILKRSVNLFSDIDPGAAASFQSEANGELAENYMGDRSDGDPLPETLPGIKLKRPWGKLLKQIEQVTGNKVSSDPNFPDLQFTRPNRRNLEETLTGVSEKPKNSGAWKWATIVAALCALLFSMRKFSNHRVRP